MRSSGITAIKTKNTWLNGMIMIETMKKQMKTTTIRLSLFFYSNKAKKMKISKKNEKRNEKKNICVQHFLCTKAMVWLAVCVRVCARVFVCLVFFCSSRNLKLECVKLFVSFCAVLIKRGAWDGSIIGSHTNCRIVHRLQGDHSHTYSYIEMSLDEDRDRLYILC